MGEIEAVFGTVLEVSHGSSMAVTTDGGVVQLVVGNDTTIRIGSDEVTLDDVVNGDRVVATAIRQDDGALVGEQILIIPQESKTVTKHIVGVVVEVEGREITIQRRDGSTVSVHVPTGVEMPEPGEALTAVAELNRLSGSLTAKALEPTADTVERIREAADRADDAQDRERLKEIAEEARNQHLSAVEAARRALDRARQAIFEAPEARAKAEQRFNEVTAKFEELQERYEEEAVEREEAPPRLHINGTLRSVDNERFVILTSAGEEFSFTYNEDTMAVFKAGEESSEERSRAPFTEVVAGMEPGDAVTVEYRSSRGDPLALVVNILPPELSAALQDALDAHGRSMFTGTITLVEQTPDSESGIGAIIVANTGGRKIVARVTVDTTITVNGRDAAIEDLAAGQNAELRLAAQDDTSETADGNDIGGNAVSISARTSVDPDETHLSGVIRDIDAETRTLAIAPRRGAVVRATVADDAAITKNGSGASFADLQAGDLVLDATRLNQRTQEIHRLVVHSPRDIRFSGVIRRVNDDTQRITVNTSRDARTLKLTATDETLITVPGTDDNASFGDLTVGARITSGEYTTEQRDGQVINVATRIIVGVAEVETVRGLVARVDHADGTLAVDTNDGALVELVAPEASARASMFKNDQQIRSLESIQPGDIVELATYTTSTGEILRLSVSSPTLERIRGTVGRVDPADSILAVDAGEGRSVELRIVHRDVAARSTAASDNATGTDITLDGRAIHTLEGVEPGDIVSLAVYVGEPGSSDTGEAITLTLYSQRHDPPRSRPSSVDAPGDSRSPSTVETSVAGVIESIEGDTWVIGGRRFIVSDRPQIFGEAPAPGLVAKASLQADSGGVFTAITISVAGRPDTNPSTRPGDVRPVSPTDGSGEENDEALFRVKGVIEAVTGNIVTVDGIRFQITRDTVISGSPAAGYEAVAVLKREGGSRLVAVSVEVSDERVVPTPRGPSRPTVPPGQPTSTATPGPTGGALETISIHVDEISEQVIKSGDRIIIVPGSMTGEFTAGADIMLRVRLIERSLLDRFLETDEISALEGNPLFEESSNDAEGLLYEAVAVEPGEPDEDSPQDDENESPEVEVTETPAPTVLPDLGTLLP